MPSGTLRVTGPIRAVMTAILEAPPGEPPWGWALCERTGYGTGTVYPALDKLLIAGWVTAEWEDPPPDGRPRRRFYYPAYHPGWYQSRIHESGVRQ